MLMQSHSPWSVQLNGKNSTEMDRSQISQSFLHDPSGCIGKPSALGSFRIPISPRQIVCSHRSQIQTDLERLFLSKIRKMRGIHVKILHFLQALLCNPQCWLSNIELNNVRNCLTLNPKVTIILVMWTLFDGVKVNSYQFNPLLKLCLFPPLQFNIFNSLSLFLFNFHISLIMILTSLSSYGSSLL